MLFIVQIAINPKGCILGCYDYFSDLNESELEFENKFSPCVLSNKDGVLYFTMEVGQKKMETVAIAPASFYFEYLFYLAMKQENDLYYVRKERCDQFIRDGHFSSIAVCLYIG